MQEPIKFTRQELYDLVWSRSIESLSKEIGISGVGLAKACRRIEVPRPPRGYWARVEAGQSPAKEQLPPPSKDCPDCTIIDPKKNRRFPNPAGPRRDRVKVPRQMIPVDIPEDLRGCSKLISCTKRSLIDTKYPEHGLLQSTGQNCINLRVSKNSLQRALLILEACFKALKNLGWSIRTEKKEASFTVIADNEKIDVKFREKLDRFESESSRFSWRAHNYEYKPSGNLMFEIDGYPYNPKKVS